MLYKIGIMEYQLIEAGSREEAWEKYDAGEYKDGWYGDPDILAEVEEDDGASS